MSVKPLPPPRPSLKKFGKFPDSVGLRLVEWDPDRAVMELDIGPEHLNGFGVVHGGVIMTLLDTACAHAGIYCTVAGNRRLGASVSLTVNLVGNLKEGRLIANAVLKRAGKTLFFASCDVVDHAGNLIATGEAVCRYARGSEKPEGVPGDQVTAPG